MMAKQHGDLDGKFPLTVGEQKGISIGNDDIEELRMKGLKCLLGKMGDAKRINKEAFNSMISRIWCLRGNVFFNEILDNLWLFEFLEEENLRRVLDGRPWSYDRTILVLNEFDSKTLPS
jgi:hypothetical protein